MKKTMILVVVLIASLTLMNCKKNDSTAFAKEVGMKLCNKMSQCMQEKLTSIPEAQREMVKGMIPDCNKEMAKEDAKGEKKSLVLSAEEINLGKSCIDKLDKTGCGDMEKTQIPECGKFAEIMSAKEKAAK